MPFWRPVNCNILLHWLTAQLEAHLKSDWERQELMGARPPGTLLLVLFMAVSGLLRSVLYNV